MDPQLLAEAAGVGVIVGLVQVFIKPWVKDERFYPVASVVFGVVWSVAIAIGATHTPIAEATISGVLVGLSASGVWSAGRAMVTHK